jgi:DNA topoisomerase IB
MSELAASSDTARTHAIARVVQEVAANLGNTPAVARASYIDPRVIGLHQDGRTIASALGELMAQHQDLSVLPPRLPPQQASTDTARVRSTATASSSGSYATADTRTDPWPDA